MTTCVILNPRAGSADASRDRLRQAVDRLAGAEVRETGAIGEARTLAAGAVEEGFSRVVAAGGDGTLNEVLQGLAPDFDRVELGLIPVGTGNDLARTLGIPHDPVEALEVLEAGAVRTLDVARFTGSEGKRWFLNVSAGGFSGEVDEHLDPEVKAAWGPLSYVRTAFDALAELEPYRTELTLSPGTSRQEELELSIVNLIVANGRYVAGGLPVAPEAAPDDGLLDLVVIRAAPVGRLSLVAARVALGQHLEHELVLHRRVRSLKVTSTPPMVFNTDGELAGPGPARFQVIPRAVRFVAPAA